MSPSAFAESLSHHAAGIEAALWTLCAVQAFRLAASLLRLLMRPKSA